MTSGAGTETPERRRPAPETARPARLPAPTRPAVELPRPVWVGICLLGVLVALMFSLLPVSARFGDDPLLRLRDLNPELSPPVPSAGCGAAIRSLDVQPVDTSLFEVAKARACERAGQRRVAGSVAAGAILIMVGFLGMGGGIPTPSGLKPS